MYHQNWNHLRKGNLLFLEGNKLWKEHTACWLPWYLIAENLFPARLALNMKTTHRERAARPPSICRWRLSARHQLGLESWGLSYRHFDLLRSMLVSLHTLDFQAPAQSPSPWHLRLSLTPVLKELLLLVYKALLYTHHCRFCIFLSPRGLNTIPWLMYPVV